MDTRTKRKRDRLIALIKWMRPYCPGTKDGKHAMIEYRSTGTKECADCQYKESIIIKVD